LKCSFPARAIAAGGDNTIPAPGVGGASTAGRGKAYYSVMMARTRHFPAPLAAALLVLAAALPVAAQGSASSVGLGVAVGLAFPQGDTPAIPSTDWRTSFNWGFYVNIPVISTLHLTPSAELYRFNAVNATDFSLAFKFIVPLARFDLYAGLAPGLTAVADVIAPNVGLLAGGSFRLAGNLDLFVQGKYDWIFEGGENLRVLHVNTGILFVF
jgi:hypothetical protein